MPQTPMPPRARELFRYARLHRPRIVDLASRLEALAEPAVQAEPWGNRFRASKEYVHGLGDLGLSVFEYLALDEVPVERLPCRRCIADAPGLHAYLSASKLELADAKRRLTLSLVASTKLGDRASAANQARALQFLEALPTLHLRRSELPYAPVVTRRTDAARRVGPTRTEAEGSATIRTKPADALSRDDVLAAWDVANAYVKWKRNEIANAIVRVRDSRFTYSPPEPPLGGKDAEDTERLVRRDRREKHQAYLSAKTAKLRALTADLRGLKDASIHEIRTQIRMDEAFGRFAARKYGEDVRERVQLGRAAADHVSGFAAAFEAVAKSESKRPSARSGCVYDVGNPCAEELWNDGPRVQGTDDVRPIGVAQLITVEERWMRYTPGEISAIETILKGEIRKKSVKRTQAFEEMTETFTQQSEEKESQTESKVEQELSSQIETEISSRFDSDVNSSVTGSGGGSIGVVDFEGGASLNAGVGVGVDTALSTSEGSNFSQEIVSKAIERTKKLTHELRRSRSYRLFETTDYHEINNAGPNAAHTNGIYCYLDKHVCITERVYGLRKFLSAELLHPGKSFVQEEMQKRALNIATDGLPPIFELSPEDISPDNYLSLVGKYRAANVSPPPPLVQVVSKTYKTDTTNENTDSGETTFSKVTKTLAPFFGNYKRFLIQDTIEVPDGYQVQEVRVTVTHGSNGVSIPAHLPFSLIGAAIFALPTIAAGSTPYTAWYYLPIAVWQIMMTASPVMHYNVDSSNVTINIGHENAESPYFFFQPDVILNEVVQAFANSTVIDQEFIDFLREKIEALSTAFASTDQGSVISALSGLSDAQIAMLESFRTQMRSWLNTLVTNIIPSMLTGGSGSGPPPMTLPTLDPAVISAIPEAILEPFRQFFDAVVSRVELLMQDALGDIFEYFNSMIDNTDTRTFGGMKGLTGELPISFNCVALKPGITVNLSAFMVRVEDQSLDAWRLETFERLNQAYYQLEADYESRTARGAEPDFRASPGLMREVEREVVKTRIMRTLQRKYGSGTSPASLDELQLFEHAIDWQNMSYRLYNYGPHGHQVAMQKLGFYATADERRRRFMDALWCQVLLPLRDDARLEQVMIKYLETGHVDFQADLLAELADTEAPLDELTAIYRDLVLQRENLGVLEERHRQETLPTDLIVIYEPPDGEPYPVNPIACPEPNTDVTP